MNNFDHTPSKVKLTDKVSRIFTLALISGAGTFLAAETQVASMRFPPSESAASERSVSTEETTEVQIEQGQMRSDAAGPKARGSRLWVESSQANRNSWLVIGDWQRSLADIRTDQDLAASPFRKRDTLQLAGVYQAPLTDRITAFAQGALDIHTDTTATFMNGHSLIATTGASIAVSPKLKFSIGMLTNQRFLGATEMMPILGLDWDITDRLKLRTLNGAFLSYELNRSTEIDLSLQYFDQSFAVENLQGTVFMRMDQPLVVEESSLVGTLGVRHNWKDVFSIRAFAEIVGQRELHTPHLSDGVESKDIPTPEDRRLSFGVEGGIRF